MKANTAASLLRAMRSRIESWGVVQVGQQELVALECAYQVTNNKLIKVIQGKGAIGLCLLLPNELTALRDGYKALETVPSKEWKFDNIPVSIKIDTLSDEELEKLKKEQPNTKTPTAHTDLPKITDGSWAKALGLTEEDIKESLKENDNQTDQPN